MIKAELLGFLALALVGYIAYQKIKDLGVQNGAAATVGVVADAATGTVLGIGDAVGVPRTNQDQCQIDLANGDLWKASFSCPAGTFVSHVFN